MLAAQDKSGCKLGINQVLRTNPRFAEAKRLADCGYFGDLFFGEADYVHNISHLITSGGGATSARATRPSWAAAAA